MKGGLVLGGSGFVGRRLVGMLGPRGIGTRASHAAPGLIPFDATVDRLSDLLARLPIPISHVFVLCGVVNPDRCAREPEATARTNVDGIEAILEQAFAASLVPVFVSTDYVFDGRRAMRSEDEPQCPTTEYGRQKAAIERWLQRRSEPWLIARLSKVVSGDTATHSVLGQWVNDIRDRKRMRSATDQVFSPAFVDDIARALIDLADGDATGIFHVAGDEPLSRFRLNEMLLQAVRREDPSIAAVVEPCALSEIPFKEARPLDTSLSTEKLRAALRWRFQSMGDLTAEIASQHFRRPQSSGN